MVNLGFEIEDPKGKRRNGVSKSYVVALCMVIVALLMVTVTFVVLYLEKPEEVKIEYCTTSGCLKAADDLMRSINASVDPCDNFYEFACGSWSKTNPIPEDKGRWGVFDVLRVDVSNTLKDLLEADAPEAIEVIKKMRTYYRSCLDEDAIDAAGIFPLYGLLQNIFPQSTNFPFETPQKVPSKREILQAFSKARKYGLTLGVISNGVSSDPEDSKGYLISFDVGPLPMERAFYLKTENQTELAAYRVYLTKLFKLFAEKMGKTYGDEQANRAADSLITFETFLAEKRMTPQERRDPKRLINKMPIKDLAANYSSVIGISAEAIVDYFKTAWTNEEVNKRVTNDTVINLAETNYYKEISNYLAGQLESEVGRRNFANYILWNIAQGYISRLGNDFRNISQEFSAVLRGLRNPVPRWETCVNTLNNEFPNAIGRLYVEDNFKKATKDKLDKMVNYVFDAFRQMVEEADWMTPATRQNALKKSQNFAVHIGYEDYIVENTQLLNEEHAELNVSSSFLDNTFSVQQLNVKNEGKRLFKRASKDTWISGAAIVNAFYSPPLNSITFPAGILQPPFMGADYPDYWNFGAVGMVIGHEITHGFDNRGSQYDDQGNFNNWWDQQSRDEFDRRTRALAEQYFGYTMQGIQLNGNLTLGENIADNGGIKEAFRAYKMYIEKEHKGKQEPRLPHLTFSPEQLFFLANAQVWCSEFRQKDLESQIRTGVHSPGRYRVIGPMQNFDEFAKAFSCPVNSYMNPETKNVVW